MVTLFDGFKYQYIAVSNAELLKVVLLAGSVVIRMCYKATFDRDAHAFRITEIVSATLCRAAYVHCVGFHIFTVILPEAI